jgi:hypothetical protein
MSVRPVPEASTATARRSRDAFFSFSSLLTSPRCWWAIRFLSVSTMVLGRTLRNIRDALTDDSSPLIPTGNSVANTACSLEAA